VAETLEWTGTDIPDELWRELEAISGSTEDPEANREYKLG
jgi:D-threo-aldose 1-dehydrogenase